MDGNSCPVCSFGSTLQSGGRALKKKTIQKMEKSGKETRRSLCTQSQRSPSAETGKLYANMHVLDCKKYQN